MGMLSGFSKAKDLIEATNRFLDLIPDEIKQDVADGLIDIVEKKAAEKNKTGLLSICKVIRTLINVPDDDEDDLNPI